MFKIILVPVIAVGAFLGINYAIITAMYLQPFNVAEKLYVEPVGTSAIDQPPEGLSKTFANYQLQPAIGVK